MKKVISFLRITKSLFADAYSWIKFKYLIKEIQTIRPKVKINLEKPNSIGLSDIFFSIYTYDEYIKFRQTKKSLNEFIQYNHREKTLDGRDVTPEMIKEMLENGFVGRSFRSASTKPKESISKVWSSGPSGIESFQTNE